MTREIRNLLSRLRIFSQAVHGVSRHGRNGRRFSATGRHAIEPKHDPHKLEKHNFVLRVVKLLDTAYDQGAFGQLIVVAPERSLGEFRDLASDRLMRLVVSQIPKELTQYSDHELIKRLKPHLAEVVD